MAFSRLVKTMAALVLAFLLGSCGGGNDSVSSVPQRKNAATLSSAERAEFVATLLRMKTLPSQFEPALSAYDYFVDLHVRAFAGPSGAHMAPGFLPWHREFLRRFEAEMRRASGNLRLTLPYWDWTDSSSVAAIFSDDFLGGNGDATQSWFVTSGPFRKGNWPMAANYDNTDDEFDDQIDADTPLLRDGLQRRFNQNYNVPLPNALQVASLLEVARRYDAAPYDMFADPRQSMRNYLEGSWPSGSAMHTAVHVWVGAQMQTASSPNDPVFFLHHANIDRLWSLWQARYGNDSYPADGSHNDLEPLFQFGQVTPRQTFDLQQHSGVRYQ
jgi:tyrosinase